MRFYLLLCLTLISISNLRASSPPPGYKDKSVKELLSMLGRNDPVVRENAAAGIAWRLGVEKFAVTNVEPSLVKTILLKTSLLVQNDDVSAVRLAGIAVLVQLDAWTNTIPFLIKASADTNQLVRIRAITALLELNKNHHEHLPSVVFSRLEECLNPNTDPETLWQACFAAGETGSLQFLPSLKILSKNSNPKVRLYASEAIKKLENHAAPSTAK